jgi:hypothetical protein
MNESIAEKKERYTYLQKFMEGWESWVNEYAVISGDTLYSIGITVNERPVPVAIRVSHGLMNIILINKGIIEGTAKEVLDELLDCIAMSDTDVKVWGITMSSIKYIGDIVRQDAVELSSLGMQERDLYRVGVKLWTYKEKYLRQEEWAEIQQLDGLYDTLRISMSAGKLEAQGMERAKKGQSALKEMLQEFTDELADKLAVT